MKKKKLKPSLKVALASTIAVTSAATIVCATPEIIKTVAAESNENKFILDVESVDKDTVKVSLDNIEDIPKAIQFSIKLDGVVLKGNSITDLVNKDKSDKILTDYTYNEADNTIDVLITSQDSIPKTGNKIEIFELDVEKASNNETREYSITNEEGSEYKYISNTNKEYVGDVEVSNEELSINTAPKIEKSKEGYIEINAGEKVSLTSDELNKYIKATDEDNDQITLEVKNVDGKVIQEFSSNTAGIYDLYVTAKDTLGAESETLNLQVKVNEIAKNPEITKDGQELNDVTINAGEVFNLMDGVKAVDAFGNDLTVTVKSDKELNLDPEVTTKYQITYTATDINGRTTEKTITLTVKANKAPVITGVTDHTLTVGDEFDPKAGVEVSDEDSNIELVIESNVNTKIAGVYKVTYKATDSGNKTTIKQSIVVVNPKMESINSIPVINASDVVIQLGQEFNPLNGVTATDNEDGPIETINVVKNEVDNKVAGKYEVTYSATDSAGATAIKTISVIVNDPPKIIAEDKVVKLGEKFEPLAGVTAEDKEDGKITNITVTENNVDTAKEGNYKVTYSVEDSLGGKATKTINVTVKKNITLAESITINNKFDSLYVGSSKVLTATVDEKAEVKDIEWTTSDDNIASIEVIGNDAKITAKSKGQVTITAKTTDGSNIEDSVTINILNHEDVVADFIKDIIDTNIVTPVSGNGNVETPVEMEVKDIEIEEFTDFVENLKDLNPVLVDKHEDGDFTTYKIKVKKNSMISKFIRLFKASSEDEAYINLKFANNLDNKDSLMAKLDEVLTIEENPGEDNNQGGNEDTNTPGDNNQGGNEDTNTPGDNNQGGNEDTNTPGDNNQGGNEGTNTPGDNNQGGNEGTNTPGDNNQGGNEGTNTPGDNNQGGNEDTNTPGDNNQGENENTNTPSENNSDEEFIQGDSDLENKNESQENKNHKLPGTGQESILGYLAIAATVIGGILYKKKK